VLVERLGGRPEKELAGHLEMKDQAEPALDADADHLPAAADVEDAAAGEFVEPERGRPADELFQAQPRARDLAAADERGEAPDDRLDFRQFRHADILSRRQNRDTSPRYTSPVPASGAPSPDVS
jgi:hypothetical protein